MDQLLALERVRAKAESIRHSLSTGWMAGIPATPLTTRIMDARTEVTQATNSLQGALARYENAVSGALMALRDRTVEALSDDGTDERESVWQAGYAAVGEDAKVLLRDIKLRLDEDAHDERDRMDDVSEQTKDLLRRVEGALHDDDE